MGEINGMQPLYEHWQETLLVNHSREDITKYYQPVWQVVLALV